MALYNSYDQYLQGGAAPGDLYGSYDAMPGAPGGGLQSSYDVPAGGLYNSYDSYIAPGGGGGGYGPDPYFGGGGFNPSAGGRAPHPSYDQQDIRGVGITFDQKASASGTAAVFVKRIARGSSAARAGKVHPGDILMRVNGVDFTHRPLSDLRPVIPGPAGSVVRLTFRRYDGGVYDVDLRRTSSRLGSKNSSYYSSGGGAGASHQQPPPRPSPYQQQMYQQQQQQQYLYQQQLMQQQQQFIDPYGGALYGAQQFPGAYVNGGVSYLNGGASYIVGGAPQGISYVSAPQQQISYVSAPAQQVSFVSAAPAASTQQVTSYTTTRTDDIKGTQV